MMVTTFEKIGFGQGLRYVTGVIEIVGAAVFWSCKPFEILIGNPMHSRSKILVFPATNSTQSINKRLARHAAKVLQDELAAFLELEIIDLNDYEMPIYSPEREQAGISQLEPDFYEKIRASDGLIILFSEYNGTYTAAFKNIFDRVSRISMKVFQDKPTLLMAISLGGRGRYVCRSWGGLPAFWFEHLIDVQFRAVFRPFCHGYQPLPTPELALELREALVSIEAALPVS